MPEIQASNRNDFKVNSQGTLEAIFAKTDVLYIPDGVLSISADAFADCDAECICLPDTVEHVAPGAFRGSTFECIRLSSNMGEIPDDAFADCINLKVVDNADNICKIGKGAFSGCINLESVNHLESIEYVGDYAFENTGIKMFDLSEAEGCTLGEGVFANCRHLAIITFNEQQDHIPAKLFYNCPSLSKTNVFGYAKHIGEKAFFGCKSLTAFESDVTSSLGESAFENSGLTKVFLGGDELLSVSESCFANCQWLSAVKLPDSVKTICRRAFYGCVDLFGIYLPSNLSTIEEYAFYGCSNRLNDLFFGVEDLTIKHKAFAECTNLAEVFFSEYSVLDDDVFSKTKGEKVKLVCAPWGNVEKYAREHSHDVVFVNLMEEIDKL